MTTHSIEDVRVLQLITGQAVVGYVALTTTANGERYVVDEPHEAVLVRNQQGQPTLHLVKYGRAGGLLPAMTIADFRTDHVLHVRACPEQLLKPFLEAASGIAIPTAEQKSAIITGA